MHWGEVPTGQRKVYNAGQGYHQEPVPGLSEEPGVVAGAEEFHTLHNSFQHPDPLEAILEPEAYQEGGLQNLGPAKDKEKVYLDLKVLSETPKDI